jgi:hypothetical protein
MCVMSIVVTFKCHLCSLSWRWACNAQNMYRTLILNKLNKKCITLVSLYWWTVMHSQQNIKYSFSSKWWITFYTVTLMQGSCKVALKVNEWKLTLHLPAELPCTFLTLNFINIHSIIKDTCGRTLPFTWCRECMVNSKSKQVFRPQNTQVAVRILHWWYFTTVCDGLEMLKNCTKNFP